ncbi:Hypothetical predicted protein, partial [Mytilus galloprovincialis]
KQHSKLQKEKNEITATKDQANLLHDAENSSYAKVILKHEHVLKDAVEEHIAKLRNELDQNHKACTKTTEESINAISKVKDKMIKRKSRLQMISNTTGKRAEGGMDRSCRTTPLHITRSVGEIKGNPRERR